MKSILLKCFLVMVFFSGSGMVNAPGDIWYYGACDVYPEGVTFDVKTQPAGSKFRGEINGNRFEFSCNKTGDCFIRFRKDGYGEKIQEFTVTEDGFTIYGDVRLVQQP